MLDAAPLLPGVGFAAILVVECAVACEIFGRILHHTDLQDLGVAE